MYIQERVEVVEGIETKDTRKKQRPKKFYVLLCILLLSTLGEIVLSFVGYQEYSQMYRSDMSLAKDGAQNLKGAMKLLSGLQKNPFDTHAIALASQDFIAAEHNFQSVQNDLQSIPGMATSIPVYGSRLRGALRLLPIAIEVSQAGVTGCTVLNLLIGKFRDPLSSKGGGMTAADMVVVGRNVAQIKNELLLIIAQVKQLQPSDLQLDPSLGKMMGTFQKELPTIEAWLNNSDSLVATASTLLGIGTPANYMLEVLDSTELRPTGGFIGNFGFASVSGGRLLSTHIEDTYLFDRKFRASGKALPYPAMYSWFHDIFATDSWSLRDSNLEGDFPTSAQYAEMNYQHEGGTMQIQGVVTITPALIQKVLTITGPITIPEYHDTVTAQNLIERIHYHQLGDGREGGDVPSPDGVSSVRKHFTGLLSQYLMARIHKMGGAAFPKLMHVLIDALHTKDMQVYFNASMAEQILQKLHMDGAIQPRSDDNLFVVDTNIAQDKANRLLTYNFKDQITLDENGNALHHSTLTYTWGTYGDVYGRPLYRDYVRVYLPAGSKVVTQDGWEPRGSSTAYNHQMVAGFFTLVYGQTRVISLTWTAPNVAVKNGQSWHYQFFQQKQASVLWKVQVQVQLPSCAAITGKQGSWKQTSKNTATLNMSLTEDTASGLDYTCR